MLEPVVTHAEANRVTVAIERLTSSESLKISYDLTSLYGLEELIDPEPFIRRAAEALAVRIGIVHLNEVALAEEFHIHAGLTPMGSGRTNWRLLLATIADAVAAGTWVLIEHVQSREEGAASVDYIRGLLDELGVL